MNQHQHRLGFLFAVTVFAAGCASTPDHHPDPRGTLDNIETLQRFSRASINQANAQLALSGAAQCDVKIVQLTYRSIGVKGEPETLSAGLYVPEHCAGPFPLVAQAHGTQSEKQRLTTQVGPGNAVVAFFAARGYLVVATDYLGLGKSDYPYHPYLHADSEASAIIDSIRAAKAAASQLGVPVNDQVMLFGYSQGGHAAMAAQREIERHYRDEIHLVASAPMSGPYNLTQTFLGSWFGQTAGEENVFASELFSYAVVSYRQIYDDVCADIERCFARPYANVVTTLFPSRYDLSEIREQNVLPPGRQLNRLRTPELTSEFLLNERQPLRQALMRNDLLAWTPAAPMILCGSRRDAMVDFNNAYAAQASFRTRGVEVPVVDVADKIPDEADGTEHHGYAVAPCYAAARKMLFDPIKRGDQPCNAQSCDAAEVSRVTDIERREQ